MSGFGDELNSVLQSPLTQTLAPAILGGVGGALSAPPMLGRRGAIGYGLQGGAQGLERGMELAGQQQNRQLEAQKLQQEIKDAAINNQIKQHVLDDDQAADAYAQTITDPLERQAFIADRKGYLDRKMATSRMPMNIRAAGLSGNFTPDQVKALQTMDPMLAEDIIKKGISERGEPLQQFAAAIRQQHQDWPEDKVLTEANAQLHQNDLKLQELTIRGQQQQAAIAQREEGALNRIEAQNENKTPKLVPVYDPATKTTTYQPAENAIGKAVPPKSGGSAPKLVPSDDGVYHQVLPDGTDRPTTIKVPKKGKTEAETNKSVAATIKDLTNKGYEIKGIDNNDNVTFSPTGMKSIFNEDMTINIPGASAFHSSGGDTSAAPESGGPDPAAFAKKHGF